MWNSVWLPKVLRICDQIAPLELELILSANYKNCGYGPTMSTSGDKDVQCDCTFRMWVSIRYNLYHPIALHRTLQLYLIVKINWNKLKHIISEWQKQGILKIGGSLDSFHFNSSHSTCLLSDTYICNPPFLVYYLLLPRRYERVMANKGPIRQPQMEEVVW